MLKLKTVYPYGLHYRIEEKGQNKSECEDLTRNAFPNLSLPKGIKAQLVKRGNV